MKLPSRSSCSSTCAHRFETIRLNIVTPHLCIPYPTHLDLPCLTVSACLGREPSGDMAEASSHHSGTVKAVKDRNCPYCHQAFTSSSLGRHLDLYIREKNPKAPDGIHDVDEIRRLRGGVTRRQPRGSISRRDTSASIGTPAATSRKSPGSEGAESAIRSPLSQKEAGRTGGALDTKYPLSYSWEATGVINDIPPRGEAARGGADDGAEGSRQVPQRAISRQMMKQQLDARQRVQDTMDTAKAAELALREIVSSLRAAKCVQHPCQTFSLLTPNRQHVDIHTMPFDFDPLSLDFPALTLRCLVPPPTLFSSTQHPTSTSWSIIPPGPKQLEALRGYFKEGFRKRKLECVAAATAANEELRQSPSTANLQRDTTEAVLDAEKAVDGLEQQVQEHLDSSFKVWASLPQDQRSNLWVLELARGVGRKQKDLEKLEASHRSLAQENANLKAQIDQLNRLQQPREFKIAPPTTIFLDRKMADHLQGSAAGAGLTKGLDLGDRNAELNAVVSAAIDRWKSVIISARSSSSGLQAQRPLEAGSAGASPPGAVGGRAKNVKTTSQHPTPALRSPPLSQPPSATLANALAYAASATSVATEIAGSRASHQGESKTAEETRSAPSVSAEVETKDEEMSDEDDGDAEPDADADADAELDGDGEEDADAEMDDDDDYGGMSTLPPETRTREGQVHHAIQQQQQQHYATMPSQQAQQLDVARTRGMAPSMHSAFQTGQRSVTHGGGHVPQGNLHFGRSASSMAAIQGMGGQHHISQSGSGAGSSAVSHADMGMMQSMGGEEAMYMD